MQITVIGDIATGVSEPGQQSFSVCLVNGMYGKDILDFYCVALYLGRCEQLSTYLDRGPMTDQSKDTIKVQLSGQMNFIGVTHRSRNDLPKAHPSIGNSS